MQKHIDILSRCISLLNRRVMASVVLVWLQNTNVLQFIPYAAGAAIRHHEYAASLVQAFQQLLDNQRAASCFCISYYTSTTNHYAAGAASGANASISLPSGYPNALTGAYLYRGVLTHQPNEWAVIYAASSYLFIRAQESSNKLSTAPMLCYQLYTYSQWCYSRLFVAPLC